MDNLADTEIRKIKFKGESFILVGDAITTEERFRNGIVSFAHLFPDGKVRRFGKIIGDQSDIELGEPVDVSMSLDGMVQTMMQYMIVRRRTAANGGIGK